MLCVSQGSMQIMAIRYADQYLDYLTLLAPLLLDQDGSGGTRPYLGLLRRRGRRGWWIIIKKIYLLLTNMKTSFTNSLFNSAIFFCCFKVYFKGQIFFL